MEEQMGEQYLLLLLLLPAKTEKIQEGDSEAMSSLDWD